MVRLMYGGRTSIYIGVAAAVGHHRILAVIVGLLAGLLPGLDRLGAVADRWT